jgi:hypothetical protein
MRTTILAAVLAALMALAGGCFVIGPDKVEHPADEATVSLIDAAGRLQWQSQKRRVYQEIALRDQLNDGAQVYLIKAVFENLELDSAKEEVLLTLIRNPQFAETAEKAIERRLGWLLLESSKRKIRAAMNLRKASR